MSIETMFFLQNMVNFSHSYLLNISKISSSSSLWFLDIAPGFFLISWIDLRILYQFFSEAFSSVLSINCTSSLSLICFCISSKQLIFLHSSRVRFVHEVSFLFCFSSLFSSIFLLNIILG